MLVHNIRPQKICETKDIRLFWIKKCYLESRIVWHDLAKQSTTFTPKTAFPFSFKSRIIKPHLCFLHLKGAAHSPIFPSSCDVGEQLAFIVFRSRRPDLAPTAVERSLQLLHSQLILLPLYSLSRRRARHWSLSLRLLHALWRFAFRRLGSRQKSVEESGMGPQFRVSPAIPATGSEIWWGYFSSLYR